MGCWDLSSCRRLSILPYATWTLRSRTAPFVRGHFCRALSVSVTLLRIAVLVLLLEPRLRCTASLWWPPLLSASSRTAFDALSLPHGQRRHILPFVQKPWISALLVLVSTIV